MPSGKKMTFDETLALALYHQHENDKEIGKVVGKTANGIRAWRLRRNLPSIAPNPLNSMVSYEEVLEPRQCIAMESFLKDLVWAGKKAVEAGAKPNVQQFIDCWREKVQG